MPLVVDIGEIEDLLARLHHRLDLEEVAEDELDSKKQNPEQSILDVVEQPLSQTTANKSAALEPPSEHVEYPPVGLLKEVANPGKDKEQES